MQSCLAGTGHAGFMEPNYTKEVKNADGTLKTVTTETRQQEVFEGFKRQAGRVLRTVMCN